MQRPCLIILILCLSWTTHAQELMRGIVGDSATFSPLPYVTVQIKNRTRGTTTDTQGNFSIVATQQDTLVFSLVGYETLELPLIGWEPSMVLMAEKVTMLKSITIRDSRIENAYESMFEEENERWRQQNKKLPFYYSKIKKEKIRVGRLYTENMRVRTYVDYVIKNEELKENLMKKHSLTETEYYNLLGEFNALNYSVMYYLTAGELITLVNNFFASHAPDR
jgi:hypothetical protein